MNCVCTFNKFYQKHLKGLTQLDWPVNLTDIFLRFKSTVKISVNFYRQWADSPQTEGDLPLEISRFTKFLLDRGATITATLSSTQIVVLTKIATGARKSRDSLCCKQKINWYKEKQRNPCKVSGNGSNSLYRTELSSDEDVIMGFFLAMSVNEDANTANRKDCTKCPNKGGEKIIEKYNNT